MDRPGRSLDVKKNRAFRQYQYPCPLRVYMCMLYILASEMGIMLSVLRHRDRSQTQACL